MPRGNIEPDCGCHLAGCLPNMPKWNEQSGGRGNMFELSSGAVLWERKQQLLILSGRDLLDCRISQLYPLRSRVLRNCGLLGFLHALPDRNSLRVDRRCRQFGVCSMSWRSVLRCDRPCCLQNLPGWNREFNDRGDKCIYLQELPSRVCVSAR
jgi:hypothetical protein